MFFSLHFFSVSKLVMDDVNGMQKWQAKRKKAEKKLKEFYEKNRKKPREKRPSAPGSSLQSIWEGRALYSLPVVPQNSFISKDNIVAIMENSGWPMDERKSMSEDLIKLASRFESKGIWGKEKDKAIERIYGEEQFK